MMKTALILLIAGLITIGSAGNTQAGHKYRGNIDIHQQGLGHWDDDISFDLDDGSIIIIEERRHRDRSTVEFTDDYELYINDERIDLDRRQKALVKEFHQQGMEIVDYAKDIGWEGAKIGVEGAKLGMRAIACLFKLLSSDYDSDDMEYEMERAAEKIEAKAEILEEKAEFIEELVEELEDIADDLRDNIPELDRLRWF